MKSEYVTVANKKWREPTWWRRGLVGNEGLRGDSKVAAAETQTEWSSLADQTTNFPTRCPPSALCGNHAGRCPSLPSDKPLPFSLYSQCTSYFTPLHHFERTPLFFAAPPFYFFPFLITDGTDFSSPETRHFLNWKSSRIHFTGIGMQPTPEGSAIQN